MVPRCWTWKWSLDAKHKNGHWKRHWTRILQNFKFSAELPLMASKSSQNKLKLSPINSKYINNIKTLHKYELLVNIHQTNNNPNFKTFIFNNMIHFLATLKPIHSNLSIENDKAFVTYINPTWWLFEEERKKEWALGPSEELSFNPTTTTPYQH